MSEFKVLPLIKILVPERLRMVEDDHALAIQASIIEHGLINPITVRKTPRAERPYTLVAGAHRLRAYELADDDWSREIEALVIEGDKDEAALVEITENLFRNELSALDRAMFVMSYREIWERKHGKISRGGDQTVKLTVWSPLQAVEQEAASGFSVHVADRLGLSISAVERAQRIGKYLNPTLRRDLRGTPEADNGSLLLKLSKMAPERQSEIAVAYRDHRDIKTALDITEPHAKAQAGKTVQQEVFERLVATWVRADKKTRADFLDYVGAAVHKPRETLPTPSEPFEEAAAAEADDGAFSRGLDMLGGEDLL